LMIRFIICVIIVVIDFIVMVPVELVGFIIGLFSKRARNAYMKFMMKTVFAVLNFCTGAKVKYIGFEKIPTDVPVLYVANHESFFDVLMTLTQLPGIVCFVAKKSFGKIPIFAQALQLYNTLFIDRDDIKQGLSVILKAIDNVKAGMSVFIFPEGTRSRDGKMNEFKEGSMKIAVKSGCPIVPIAISNTAGVFENHFPKVEAANVVVEILDPVIPGDFDKMEQKHLGKLCRDRIEEVRDRNLEKYCG
ncbi:MAG: 1-acyl-sn-glycerol-3-phosphate acyltransferase, partial [Lachnospiraceae bacterium]|nr:1-acyl-sn-glycerol-3-phosphate acyltransferase [Lachnospiraceae bacterium]